MTTKRLPIAPSAELRAGGVADGQRNVGQCLVEQLRPPVAQRHSVGREAHRSHLGCVAYVTHFRVDERLCAGARQRPLQWLVVVDGEVESVAGHAELGACGALPTAVASRYLSLSLLERGKVASFRREAARLSSSVGEAADTRPSYPQGSVLLSSFDKVCCYDLFPWWRSQASRMVCGVAVFGRGRARRCRARRGGGDACR